MPIPKNLPFGRSGDDNQENDEETFSDIDVEEQAALDNNDDDTHTDTTHDEFEESAVNVRPVDESENGDTDSHPVHVKKRKEKKKNKQPIEVDVEHKKLKPMSDNKRLRTNDFDARKNLHNRQQRWRTTVIVLIAALVLIGAYQAVFPPKPLSEDKVAQIAKHSVGETNFPEDDGRGFAKDFMKAYLTINSDEVSKRVMNYYYSGSMKGDDSDTESQNRTAASSFSQEVLYGPTVYDVKPLTDKSGKYTIAALVESKESEEGGDSTKPPSDGSGAKWVFFNVNVYYDEAQDSFAIADDSPSVIPKSNVEPPGDIPKQLELGTGEEDDGLKDDVKSLVNEFVKGYSQSSPENYSPIKQYIVSHPKSDLKTGLDDEYTLSDTNDAIDYEVYPEKKDETDKLKVSVTVDWKDAPKNTQDKQETNVTYTSHYVMTLVKSSGDKYLVSDFEPEYYVPDISDE